jgi:uncharacterized membrane protein YGL010W
MKKIDRLLVEYGESHQNPVNKMVHWICVPAIVLSLLGLIWSIPVFSFMHNWHVGRVPVNWATLFMLFTMIYYFRLSFSLALGMIVVISLLVAAGYFIATMIPIPLWASCLIIFTVARIGQFWGHKVEGKKPSFLRDVQFLLIGPVWLLSFIYRKLGIKYS